MREPPRFRNGGEDLLAASLLDAARAYRRPPSTRHRIFKMLGVPIAVSVGAPATAAVAWSLATKVVVLVSAATVVAGGGAVAHHVHTRDRTHRAQVAKMAGVAAAPTRSAPIAHPSEVAQPPVGAPLEDPPVEAPPQLLTAPAVSARARHRAPSELRHAPAVVAAAPRAPDLVAPATGAPPRTAPEPVYLPAPQAAPTPPTPSPSHVAARSRPVDVMAPAPPAPPRRPLAREIALLDAAERAERRHDYGAALATLSEYARIFPDGALLAEAQVLRIGALLRNGDGAAAEAEARSFFAHYAPSPLAARVRSMLSEIQVRQRRLP